MTSVEVSANALPSIGVFGVDTRTVFNQQKPQWYDTQYASNRVTPSRYYHQELNYTPPRQVRLSVRYDFSF